MRLNIHRARVNIKSLAAEAAIIRKEMKGATLIHSCDLYNHRILKVRPEARLANLALAYLRGYTRSKCEKAPKTEIDPEKLLNKLKRFGLTGLTKIDIINWLKT